MKQKRILGKKSSLLLVLALCLVQVLLLSFRSELASAGPDSGWSIQTVDSAGTVGYDTSIALDASGFRT